MKRLSITIATIAMLLLTSMSMAWSPTFAQTDQATATDFVARFDAAWNAHDVDAVMAFFADDAVVQVVPAPVGTPGVWTGNAQIREFVQANISGFQVESRDIEARPEERRIIWKSTVSNDVFRSFGIDRLDETVEAVLSEGGESIQSLTITIAPEWAVVVSGAALGMPVTGGSAPSALYVWVVLLGAVAALSGLALRVRSSRT